MSDDIAGRRSPLLLLCSEIRGAIDGWTSIYHRSQKAAETTSMRPSFRKTRENEAGMQSDNDSQLYHWEMGL